MANLIEVAMVIHNTIGWTVTAGAGPYRGGRRQLKGSADRGGRSRPAVVTDLVRSVTAAVTPRRTTVRPSPDAAHVEPAVHHLVRAGQPYAFSSAPGWPWTSRAHAASPSGNGSS